jgi:hypothetical protein
VSRVPVPQKELQLVSVEPGHRVARSLWPPAEATLGQTLVSQPKALAIVRQESDGRAASVAKDEDGAREGIGLKRLAAESSQGVDALSKVYRLDGDENSHVRSYLDHDPFLQKS